MAVEANILPFINVVATVTAEFGQYPSGGTHKGVDISTIKNDNVYSIVDGIVTNRGWNEGGFGNYIVCKDNQTGQGFLYGHMKEATPLQVGDSVVKGQFVGIEGTTGNSTGIHLHVESQDMTNKSSWTFGLPIEQLINPTIYMGFPNVLGTQVIYDGTPINPPKPKPIKRGNFNFVLFNKKKKFY